MMYIVNTVLKAGRNKSENNKNKFFEDLCTQRDNREGMIKMIRLSSHFSFIHARFIWKHVSKVCSNVCRTSVI